ncbi:MAG: hypothetical protein GX799_12290 [Crenarchaeota archaeon]|nr:hypothetical protein [Thermoproteota archaeon]
MSSSMSQPTETKVFSASVPNPTVLTLADMRRSYQATYTLAKQLGLVEWYLEEFGTEEQWLSQFRRMPYDEDA